MDEKSVSRSFMVISKEENTDELYPMFFGVSCAFFALKLMPEHELRDEKWTEIRNQIIKGSAHLLGLLVWTVQRKALTNEKSELIKKLENAQKEIKQLKKIRSEDAKANEKVVSIFAGREQSWFDERNKLRQQIRALMNDLRLLETKKDESISEFGEKLKEIEVILQLKDKIIEETERKRLENEEKLKAAERLIEELRENAKNEEQRHSSEISKQKAAFIELVSSQRHLEAEMGRAIRQVESTKQELDLVLGQKEQLGLVNQKLSMEVIKMHKDLEQKDQILTAMHRKSRLDTAEKQMLIKEVKASKAKRKQAEVEIERWKAVSKCKHERLSLRNMLSRDGVPTSGKNVCRFEYKNSEMMKGIEPKLAADTKDVESWVNSEAERYKIAIEQKRQVETDAFVEQLRERDEKLEANSWRLMSAELESKRLQSHIESLNDEIIQLKQDNTKLEAILMDREAELQSVQEQLKLCFTPPNAQKMRVKSCEHDAAVGDGTDWSRVKIVKRKPGHRRQEMKASGEEVCQVVEEKQDVILTLESPNKRSDSTRKVDIHALGVSFKVKRLKQQVFMLERVAGKRESCENDENNVGVKGSFCALMSLLNKQVDRYQLLQAKIDDLCMRMHENKVNMKSGGPTIVRAEEGTKRMEHILEETFQVQRYVVATGQKLMEIQDKITSNFGGGVEDSVRHASLVIARFSDGVKTLFQEVQRGLEVRISRIIGDLEGTLTCDGFIRRENREF